MQKKLLVISEINLNNENRGIEILNRTFASLSRQYSITAISVGKQPLFMHENWLKLNDTIFNKVHHIKYIGYLANYFFWAYCYLKTKIFVASNKPKFDIMYLIGPMSAFIGKNINYDNIPVINRYLGVAWDYEGYQSIPQRIRFFLKKQGYKSSQGTIIMTNDGTRGAEFLKKMGIFNKIYFMRNGITKEIAVDLGYVKHLREIYGIKHDQTVLLTVSRLASWKRVDRAICLLKELLKANDKYILMIVGDGEERDHLISLANELNCLGNIRFIGAVENKLTPNYFYLADIFLSFYDYSNAGNPLFEAMLLGKCICTLSNGDTGDFISNNEALLFTEFEQKKIAIEISRVLSDPDLLHGYGVRARSRAESDFISWDERILREMEILSSLIGAK